MRNPQTVPFDALRPQGVAYDANGNAIDQDQANKAMYAVYAGLIVGWRAYDASTPLDSEDAEQVLLPSPATADLFAKLPLEIQNRIADEVRTRQNPTKTPTTAS